MKQSLSRERCPFVFLLLLLAPLGCGRLQGEQGSERASFAPITAEIRLARQIAEQDLHPPLNPQSPLERVYFIKAEPLPGADADDPRREVNVIHYRYQHDETVITRVDLHTLSVQSVDTLRHFPTALAPGEVAHAEKLARANARLQDVFARQYLKVEGRPLQPASPAEPLFGHRLVHLLPRDGPDYLAGPRIVVDLSRDVVLLDEVESR